LILQMQVRGCSRREIVQQLYHVHVQGVNDHSL